MGGLAALREAEVAEIEQLSSVHHWVLLRLQA